MPTHCRQCHFCNKQSALFAPDARCKMQGMGFSGKKIDTNLPTVFYCVIMTKVADQSERHARVFGSPGLQPRLAGLLRVAWPLFIVAIAAGYLLRAALPFPAMGMTVAGFLFLVLAAGLAFAAPVTRGRLQSFLKGARGEEWVARELAFLPDDYVVLHGLSPRRDKAAPHHGDFDHVVIGKGGLFVIETKNWTGDIHVEKGEVLYNGRLPDRPPLEQVKQAAASLRRHLELICRAPPPIQPLLCFAGDAIDPRTQGAAGVLICHVRSINDLILKSDPAAPIADTLRAETETALRQLVD